MNVIINLNLKPITKELLLEKITDLEIYRMYMTEDVSTKGNISSPLREDKKNSFGFFKGESGEICFNDFVLGNGECIKFVMLKFGITWFEALSKIALDAGLQDEFIIKNTFKTNVNASSYLTTREEIIKQLNAKALTKTSRDWTMQDLAFWNQFGITHEILQKYRVRPVAYIHAGIEKKIIKADTLAYSYTEIKDGKETFKIYQPKNDNYKWLNTHDDSVWQGWEQMPATGKQLIITKSLKDVMSIVNVTGIPAVSLQTESALPKESIIDELKSRFKKVYLLYDNDFDKEVNWGRQFSDNLTSKFNLWQLEIPDEYKSKDFSDLVNNCGQKIAKECLIELINNAVPF